MSSAGLPPRVVATPDQLVILNAMYARTGEDATKDDIKEASRETGLQEKWIHRWIKRQRSARGRGKRKISPRVSKYDPTDPSGAADGAQTMLLDGSTHSGTSLESHTSVYAWQSDDPLWRNAPDTGAASDATGSGDGQIKKRFMRALVKYLKPPQTLRPQPPMPPMNLKPQLPSFRSLFLEPPLLSLCALNRGIRNTGPPERSPLESMTVL
ncbi:uncharacterized protein TRAVEDRAFT_46669 [Trametes versicolor FP-101664 SS1]|uniref:uncharacterized protein n=1 Tax=Trametes versicolor (strain FP-101664) TaxID=717944 RepID=UPI00046239E0|nr:uncharacterized protein TRAVEDRAFT_46669 [Trametes versicolor FP-101664 SS1]EIW59362.1 hypothetical protein TRAVEDRAFT_46669 [Trametes versicolor FP-101664 SS1]